MNEQGNDQRPASLLRRIARRVLPPATPRPEERESIWSISRRDARTFFRLVGLLWTAALAYIAVRQARRPAAEWMTEWPLAPDAPWWQYGGDFVLATMLVFAAVGVGFAILAMLLTRPLNLAGDVLMTLYQAMVNRFVNPVIERHKAEGMVVGLAKGRVEGRAEGRVEGLAEGRVEGVIEGRVEGLAEGRVEGLAEGQAAERSQWQDWNCRRLAAEAAGQPFDEPPPGAD